MFPGTQFGRREVGVVGAVGIFLGLEGQRLAVAEGFAVLAVDRAVEEITAVELQGGLVAQHLDGASRSGFPDCGGRLDAVGAPAVDDPVVVVTAAVAQLFVVGPDALADGMRLAEIERRARYVGDLTRGDQHRIDGRGAAGVDRQHVVEDGAVAFALEVEEGVVREVHDGGFVGRGVVVDAELVSGRERVGHANLQVARESLFAVGVRVGQHEPVVGGRYHVPDDAVQSVQTSVERLSVVVLRQGVFHAVEREAAAGDAVGIGAHDGAEEALAGVVDVAGERVVAQYDILVTALAVRGPERYDTGAVVGDLHGHVAGMQRVEFDGFAVDPGVERSFAEERDPRFRSAAGGEQQGAQCDNISFHKSEWFGLG